MAFKIAWNWRAFLFGVLWMDHPDECGCPEKWSVDLYVGPFNFGLVGLK